MKRWPSSSCLLLLLSFHTTISAQEQGIVGPGAEKGSEFNGRPIISIEFKGNAHVSSEELIEFMKYARVGDQFDAGKLNTDLDRCWLR
jgi:hypothetical protein